MGPSVPAAASASRASSRTRLAASCSRPAVRAAARKPRSASSQRAARSIELLSGPPRDPRLPGGGPDDGLHHSPFSPPSTNIIEQTYTITGIATTKTHGRRRRGDPAKQSAAHPPFPSQPPPPLTFDVGSSIVTVAMFSSSVSTRTGSIAGAAAAAASPRRLAAARLPLSPPLVRDAEATGTAAARTAAQTAKRRRITREIALRRAARTTMRSMAPGFAAGRPWALCGRERNHGMRGVHPAPGAAWMISIE